MALCVALCSMGHRLLAILLHAFVAISLVVLLFGDVLSRQARDVVRGDVHVQSLGVSLVDPLLVIVNSCFFLCCCYLAKSLTITSIGLLSFRFGVVRLSFACFFSSFESVCNCHNRLCCSFDLTHSPCFLTVVTSPSTTHCFVVLQFR